MTEVQVASKQALDTTAMTTIVERWLASFEDAVRGRDLDAVDDLFGPDAWWRDLLVSTWDLRTAHETEHLRDRLAALADTRAAGFALEEGKVPELVQPAGEAPWLQALFVFETRVARCRGVIRLVAHDGEQGGWVAWTLLTAMDELRGFEEATGERRPWGMSVDRTEPENWLDRREWERQFADRDPTVLIIGAGQSGLSLGARLRVLGLDHLLLERRARVGDNWRQRYHNLTLHDPVWLDHLPYMAYPPSWPVFTPKDKLADWMEAYADSMELNVWTGVELLGGTYDEHGERWDVSVRKADGTVRVLHPAHVVLATGAQAEPRVPEISGIEEYGGVVHHSSLHPSGSGFAGCKAVVIGSGVSAHDIAQDLYAHGADTTIVQRGATYVLSLKSALSAFAGLYDENGPPTEDADLLFGAWPFRLMADRGKERAQAMAADDRELLDGLARRGFRTNLGLEDAGVAYTYLQRGGGYYFDVGCSSLIVDGKVKVKSGVGIDRFTRRGVRLSDGTDLDADLVVLATGYSDMRETARKLFGDVVADRCQPTWGLDAEGEVGCLWRESGYPTLWFMAGTFAFARMYSKYLALRLKAIEEGLSPKPR
jgi:putative flavoprotein involved in K+ transport